MARKDSIVSTDIDNGRLFITVEGTTLTVDPADYPQAFIDYAALHGMKQAIVDAAALGADSTPAMKLAAIKAKLARWADSGEWAARKAGDGTTGDGLLVRAVMEFQGVDRETAQGLVGQMDKKLQAAMRASPQLAPIIERIKTERVSRKAPAVDVAAILAGLTAPRA